MNEFQQAAHRLHDLGFNVTAIKAGGKRPGHTWETWQTTQQTVDDIDALPWLRAGGVGAISGVGDLRVYDFDDCADIAPAAAVLQEFGLSTDYPWFWQSGSGAGWGVAVLCEDDTPVLEELGHRTNGKGPGVFMAPGRGFHHLELRWRDCQTVLPPSQHPTGPGYRWQNGAPTEPPAWVTPEQAVAAFRAVTTSEPAADLPTEPPPAPQRTAPRDQDQDQETERAGDEYARTHTWEDILGPAGWRAHHTKDKTTYWTRPGKDPADGVSAATGGDYDPPVLWVWSTNGAPFRPEETYTKWGAYTLLEHGGDFTAAAAQVYAERERRKKATSTGATPSSTTPQTEEPEPAAAKKAKIPAPTDDELAARWLQAHPLTAWGLGEFRRYAGGIWPVLPLDTVRREIKAVLEGAKYEGIRPTARLLASVLELARVEIAQPAEVWDADIDILVCLNGALHIPTGTLQAHSPEHLATSRLPFAYDPAAVAPVWQAVLTRCVPDAHAFLQEFAGYALTADTRHELAVWLAGQPGGGKSTILAGLEAMLGARVLASLGLADIEKSRFALTNLPGKTLAISTEQPGGYLAASAVLNALISGEPITVDRKFRDPVTIVPRAKVMWALNELPRVGSDGVGLFRRVKVVKLPPIPEAERDPNVKEQVKQEGAGILNWALAGLARLRQRGRFEIPQVVKEATDHFRETNDIPAVFVAECCKTGVNETTKKPYRAQSSLLYGAYAQWCKDNGHKPQSATSIADDWLRLGFEKKPANGRVWWHGVGMVVEGRAQPSTTQAPEYDPD